MADLELDVDVMSAIAARTAEAAALFAERRRFDAAACGAPEVQDAFTSAIGSIVRMADWLASSAGGLTEAVDTTSTSVLDTDAMLAAAA